MKYLVLLAAFVTFPVISVQAEELSTAYKSEIESFQQTIDTYIGDVNYNCGSNIKMTVDWASFKDKDYQHHNLADYCRPPLTGMINLCRQSDAFKTAVTNKVKELRCVSGPERTIELKDGVISSVIDLKSLDSDYAEKYLGSAL